MTIFALATPAGRSGIAVFRLSGEKSLEVLRALSGLAAPSPRMASLVTLKRGTEVIDRALAIYFPAPHSFTGEDVVELHTHGSRAVIQLLTQTLLAMEGVRHAEPGEFAKRAFLSGKMDLTAAEGLADLIDAETEAQHRQALRQMEGELAKIYDDYRDRLVENLAHMEALIDFSDEDLPPELAAKLDLDVRTLMEQMQAHLADNHRGERIRDGLYAVIMGPPNAGKSTLMNFLARRDVSIVSHLAGTTRDVVEVHLNLGGYAVVVADTAGIRENAKTIEAEGIRKALERAGSADLKLLVLDASNGLDESTHLPAPIDDRTLIIANKADLIGAASLPSTLHGRPVIAISLATGSGTDALLAHLTDAISGLVFSENSPIITRSRHRHAVEDAVGHLARFLEGGAVEIRAEELRLSARALATVTGQIGVEDILDQIFSRFCIGK